MLTDLGIVYHVWMSVLYVVALRRAMGSAIHVLFGKRLFILKCFPHQRLLVHLLIPPRVFIFMFVVMFNMMAVLR